MTTWEVFYTPHTDDETIGMAGAIARARSAGHDVLVCLVTDNQPSTRGQRIFPDHDVHEARRTEWRDAMRRLDVTEVQTWDIPESTMPTHMEASRSVIRDRMIDVHNARTVVHHHTTWGLWDHNQGQRCLAHDLCASAAHELFHIVAVPVSLYSVYEYAKSLRLRTAPRVVVLTADEHRIKREALKAYYPSSSSLGYGYASVPELMDAAMIDPREFVIRL